MLSYIYRLDHTICIYLYSVVRLFVEFLPPSHVVPYLCVSSKYSIVSKRYVDKSTKYSKNKITDKATTHTDVFLLSTDSLTFCRSVLAFRGGESAKQGPMTPCVRVGAFVCVFCL